MKVCNEQSDYNKIFDILNSISDTNEYTLNNIKYVEVLINLPKVETETKYIYLMFSKSGKFIGIKE
jgi:hypothetical protein